MYSGCLGDQDTSLGAQTLTAKNTFQIFFLQLYFNKKYVEVAINNSTMCLIASKWLRRQKSRQKRKTMRQKEVKAKEETLQKSFPSFKYLLDHANVCFLFYINSLDCFV